MRRSLDAIISTHESPDHPPQNSPASPEEAQRLSPDVEQVIDRIWKDYISEIDSCVGEDREEISDYAVTLSGQIRELINSVDEIHRYTLPGKLFRERVLRGQTGHSLNQGLLRGSQRLLRGFLHVI